jgi:uncharacterized Zn ribbon protein
MENDMNDMTPVLLNVGNFVTIVRHSVWGLNVIEPGTIGTIREIKHEPIFDNYEEVGTQIHYEIHFFGIEKGTRRIPGHDVIRIFPTDEEINAQIDQVKILQLMKEMGYGL